MANGRFSQAVRILLNKFSDLPVNAENDLWSDLIIIIIIRSLIF